ncbi:MAG: hypothetical protein IPJ65_04120 [Archangiaceae bacterium]|nr:hypothetical protein [Archangiaceae bacterium]
MLFFACQSPESRPPSAGKLEAPLTVTTTADFGGSSQGDSVSWLGNELVRTRPSFGVQSWQGTTALPSALIGHSTVVHGNTMVLVGGGASGTALSKSVLSSALNLDGSPAGFTSTTSFPSDVPNGSPDNGRFGQAAVAYNGYLYIVGGDNGFSRLDTVHYAKLGSNGSVSAWTKTSSFTTGRLWAQAVAYDNSLYVIGGQSSAALDSIAVASIRADGSLGAFQTTTSLPSARYLFAATAFNNRLYVAGGQTGPGNLADVWSCVINANGTLGPFKQHSSFSAQRFGHTALVADGSLYVIGGQGASITNAVEVARVYADGSLGPFASTAAFTTARFRHGSAVWGGNLYVVGGQTTTTATSATANVQLAPLLQANQARPGVWASAISLTTPRQGAASVGVNGRIYVLGGRDNLGNLRNDVEVSDFGATLFTTLASTFTTPRELAVAFTYADRLYVAGGNGASGRLDDIQFAPINANGTLGAFQTVTRVLPSQRQGAAAAIFDDHLYVVGGFDTANRNDVQVATIDPTDGSIGTFQATSSFTTPRQGHAAVIIGHTLYVIGGNGASVLTSVQYAKILPTGLLGPFIGSLGLNTPRTQLTALVWNEGLYVAGGTLTQASTEYAAVNEDGSPGPFLTGSALPEARIRTVGAVQNGQLMVIGGANATGAVKTATSSTLEGALGVDATFAAGPVLPQALEGGCATVWRDRLYVAGAVDTLGRPFVMQGPLTSDGLEAVIYRYTNPGFTYPSPACEAWNGYVYVVGEYAGPNAGVARFAVPEPPPINYIYEPIAPLSPALQRSGTRLAVWKGRLYIVGGLPDGAPEPDDRISMMTLEGAGFDGGVGSTTSLPEPLYHAGVAARDTLYVVGGITGGEQGFGARAAPHQRRRQPSARSARRGSSRKLAHRRGHRA